MAVYTYEISTEHNIYPNITVYDRLKDGEPAGWKVSANEGYVFYDSTRNDVEEDSSGNVTPVTYYYVTKYLLNDNYNWANFPYVAVPRDSVDENYIFGGNVPDHEVI